jgi:serine/threonine protein kinase
MSELKLENSLVDGRYEVFERLSRGSFAEIFVARDREANGMEVVIKALNTHLQGTPDADLERTLVENFQSEAILLDAVRHPNVILRWGHGTAADLRGVPFHYLVLEYMSGGDLLKLCRGRPNNALPLSEALFYFKPVCEALAYAHGKGIIHRDLKPNNFLLSADCRTLKIADFGVAKITSGEEAEITRVGADIYAPPEHHPGEDPGPRNRLTAAADIYSLAKSFYTVLCGRAPGQFRCDPITYLPDELATEPWGKHLLSVLRRATDDDPKVRHASVVEFWSDLAQVASIQEGPEAQETVGVGKAEKTGDETMIRPRLKVVPDVLPVKPVQPDFDPTLSSARPRARYSTATLVGEPLLVADARVEEQAGEDRVVEDRAVAEQAAGDGEVLEARVEALREPRDDDRSSKFFIELPQSKPAPAVQSPVRAPVQAQGQHKPPAKPSDGAEAKPQKEGEAKPAKPKTEKKKVEEKFNQRMRLRLFVGLLILTFFGSLVSVYNYVRKQDTPIGFGPLTEVEVVSPGLNVRLEPNGRVLGVVTRGTRHRVVRQANQDWLQIEVGQWSELFVHAETNRGWVYANLDGNQPNVRVVSRRFWW